MWLPLARKESPPVRGPHDIRAGQGGASGESTGPAEQIDRLHTSHAPLLADGLWRSVTSVIVVVPAFPYEGLAILKPLPSAHM